MTALILAATSCRSSHIYWYRSVPLLVLISIFVIRGLDGQHSTDKPNQQQHHHHHHFHRKTSEEIKTIPLQLVKILIPNLPPTQYQYWLKNHPRAASVFTEICNQVGTKLADLDLVEFQRLHSNLSFENPQYMFRLDYGKETLGLICSKIADVSRSCWGYENNCQEIYLMPECHGTSSKQDEQEQKIAWFSGADFGYILDRVRELSKFCSPDKKTNPNEVSSFECTKHFTLCRGNNLFARFDTSLLSNLRRTDNKVNRSLILRELGGWGCDLQKARIAEESGLSGPLESWYGELKHYNLVDHLKPKESCNLTFNDQVFFVKIDSTNNLDDYLATFINLYATIHFNNRFSENNQIIIWDKHLPRGKMFEQLWYAFSRHPPVSIGQLDGKTVCFSKFIFAMPPKMIEGLHTDKPLVEGCSKSGLYSAFHKHVVHRLNIPNVYNRELHQKSHGKLVRIAILSRASKSEFRNIINERELEAALNQTSSHYVKIIRYNSMDFNHVLLDALNSDIMIGLHGKGLAYSLFLPDWAGLIELHDCGKDRYHKLSRLRGISYFKPGDEQVKKGFAKKIRVGEDSPEWARLNQSRLLDHEEFSDYEIDVEQFMILFNEARDQVLAARDAYFDQPELTTAIPSPTEMKPIPEHAIETSKSTLSDNESQATTEKTISTKEILSASVTPTSTTTKTTESSTTPVTETQSSTTMMGAFRRDSKKQKPNRKTLDADAPRSSGHNEL